MRPPHVCHINMHNYKIANSDEHGYFALPMACCCSSQQVHRSLCMSLLHFSTLQRHNGANIAVTQRNSSMIVFLFTSNGAAGVEADIVPFITVLLANQVFLHGFFFYY